MPRIRLESHQRRRHREGDDGEGDDEEAGPTARPSHPAPIGRFDAPKPSDGFGGMGFLTCSVDAY